MVGTMALIRRVGFTRFSRFGANLGRLHVTSAKHTEALDGTDELSVTCSDDVCKGDYIVWIDNQGVSHEHIVDDVEREHCEDGTIATTFTAVNSIAELWDDWTDDKRPSGQVAVALQSALNGTRWTVGVCDLTTSASAVLYHQSVRESISEILDAWGGELETTIVTDGSSVTSRSVGVRRLRGNQQSPKRFTWTKDIKSFKRKVSSDNPKTRVYGYGKGVETDNGGYGRRLTFESVNGGKPYVEDVAATKVWGHPGKDGAILPACTSYVNEDCEDAAQLLAESMAYLAEVSEPKVSYEASVIDLYAFGLDWEGVGVGDRVAIIDKGFSESGVRINGRVSQLERDLLTGDAEVTFGNLQDSMADMWQSVSQTLRTRTRAAATYDAVASTSTGWLTRLQGALNDQFNAAGTYKVETFELGTIWSNVPIDAKTGLPLETTASMWAVNKNGRGLRLAKSLAADGQWDWRVFITGADVDASCINAGTMTADRVRAGLLTDDGGKNFWNLSTGEFRLSSDATVGGKTVGEQISDATKGLVSSVVVLYATGTSEKPTGAWSTNPPAWADGVHVWTKTRTVRGQIASETYPVDITGATGQNGLNGTSVSVSNVEWASSSSGTDAPTEGWQSAIPSVSQGSWLWCRTSYSDGSSALTCSYMGTDGKDGSGVAIESATKVGKTTTLRLKDTDGTETTLTIADGEDGSNGNNGADGKTVHIAWATSPDGSEGFSTTDSSGKTFIGVYRDTSQDDSQTPSDYSWSQMQGQSFYGMSVQYYLSTSDTAQTGGSWSQDQPEWSENHYIWTRTRVVYGIGSNRQTHYSTPVLAKSINLANNNAKSAQDAVIALDDSLTQQGIFNRLTNGGQEQGVYLDNGKVYINASYINTGTIDASVAKIINLLKIGTDTDWVSIDDGEISFGVNGTSDAMTIKPTASMDIVTNKFSDNWTYLCNYVGGSGNYSTANYSWTTDSGIMYSHISAGMAMFTFRFVLYWSDGGFNKTDTGSFDVPFVAFTTGSKEYTKEVHLAGDRYIRITITVDTSTGKAAYAFSYYSQNSPTIPFRLLSITTYNTTSAVGASVKTKDGDTALTTLNFSGEMGGYSGELRVPFMYGNTMRNYCFRFSNGILTDTAILTPSDAGYVG